MDGDLGRRGGRSGCPERADMCGLGPARFSPSSWPASAA